MELEIITKKENPLLSREEVNFKVIHTNESTPSRKVIVAKLAAMLNADKDRTILKEVKGEFGVNYAIGRANVYETAELAKKIEPNYILKRSGLIGEEDK